MADIDNFTDDMVADAERIVESAQKEAHRAINAAYVMRNWELGKRIAEEMPDDCTTIQMAHSDQTHQLADVLTEKYGDGYARPSLGQYVQFYRRFPQIGNAVRGDSQPLLSWPHYRELLLVEDDGARAWYEHEAIEKGWGVLTLARSISDNHYERMHSSDAEPDDGECVSLDATDEKEERLTFVMNPMVLRFLGLEDNPYLHESPLESAILTKVQQFMIDSDKGYEFVTRQLSLAAKWDGAFIDLVFYNNILGFYVLVNLVSGKIDDEDVELMDAFMHTFDVFRLTEGANPVLGMVLSTETDDVIANYSVLNDDEGVLIGKYEPYLPDLSELKEIIDEQKRIFHARAEGAKGAA